MAIETVTGSSESEMTARLRLLPLNGAIESSRVYGRREGLGELVVLREGG